MGSDSTLCFDVSRLRALSLGNYENALWELGALPEEHRTDSALGGSQRT